MSFGGGGSGAAGITAHLHNTQSGEGGNLKGNQSIVLGSSISFNAGAELPIEVLL